MRQNIPKFLTILLSLVFFSYLLLPPPPFPPPPPGSLQSTEPGDVRNPDIRAYFTDLSREEVISFYQSQFSFSPFFHLPLPTIRLKDYPPEEVAIFIQEQTKSWYLEELVHPLRESIFINGFDPKVDKDAIIVDNRRFQNKVTIRVYPSHPVSRVLVGVLILFSLRLLLKSLRLAAKIA